MTVRINALDISDEDYEHIRAWLPHSAFLNRLRGTVFANAERPKQPVTPDTRGLLRGDRGEGRDMSSDAIEIAAAAQERYQTDAEFYATCQLALRVIEAHVVASGESIPREHHHALLSGAAVALHLRSIAEPFSLRPPEMTPQMRRIIQETKRRPDPWPIPEETS